MLQLRSNVSLSEGQNNLQEIIKTLGSKKVDWNEATTRFHIIDRILIECLGWPKTPEKFKVEVHNDGEFRDYVLGEPATTVWEAKRAGIHFDLPADIQKKPIQSIQEIFSVSKSAESAMRQAQSYCSDSGIEFAVISNGYQLIAFIAMRVGHSWVKGRALAIRSLEQLNEEFSLVWQCLSPDGMSEKRLLSLLTSGSTRSIPRKLSSQLSQFPAFRYKTTLQANLRGLSELLLEDIISTEAIRTKFYNECYCDTGALSRDALVSEKILQGRYAALFGASEQAPQIESLTNTGETSSLTNQILTEALARRPIVLLGDVGVGKTSFLEDLMYVRAPKEFSRAINIYIDLGSKAALEVDIRNFVIDEIERQLLNKYQVDIQENGFVRGVYDLEVKRFRKSFKAALYETDKEKLDLQIMLRLEELVNNKSEHLRHSIEHVSRAHKRQIIIILDNADQRAMDIQQSAFIISQEFARNWNALVFITVRPQTFFQSKRAGALSAYPHKVFTISPPRPELVIEKRLVFALKIAEGKISPDLLKGVSLNLSSMVVFLKVLLSSLKQNRDLTEILANITGGNIRAVVEFVTNFIGSPNVDAVKIVDLAQSGEYIIPVHEFSKAAILGEYSHFVPDRSLAMNLFDVQSADRKEHFLSPMIVSLLLAETTVKDRDGFIHTSSILGEMQKWGFLPNQIEVALRKLTNKHLIETTERITFEEDLTGLIGHIPEGFRATTIGAYHIRRWIGTFAYLDAMVFDTPIFDEKPREAISEKPGSFDILDRYARSLTFRTYLSSAWDASGMRPTYFDWNEVVKYGQNQFDSVRKAISRNIQKHESTTSTRYRKH